MFGKKLGGQFGAESSDHITRNLQPLKRTLKHDLMMENLEKSVRRKGFARTNNELMVEKIIVRCLMIGKTQAEISKILSDLDIKPCSLSSLEKRLKRIKCNYNAKTMFHLGVILSKKYKGK